MLRFRAALLPCAVVAAVFAAEPAEPSVPLAKVSPFQSRGASGPAAAANETLEFAGVSSVSGKKPDLIFHDKTAKKNYWIAEGETKEGISVLKYDQRREMVVVKVNGTEKTLALRKGTGAVNAPTPAAVPPTPTGFNTPAPTAPAPAVAETPVSPPPAPKPEAPATPEATAKAETEARMLVSDLLEIGMAQRKAYEEAQRRAAQGNNATQPAATDGTTPTTAQNDSQQPATKPNGN